MKMRGNLLEYEKEKFVTNDINFLVKKNSELSYN